jgi:hypothetical protein
VANQNYGRITQQHVKTYLVSFVCDDLLRGKGKPQGDVYDRILFCKKHQPQAKRLPMHMFACIYDSMRRQILFYR